MTVRAKTTPASTPGSYAPSGGKADNRADVASRHTTTEDDVGIPPPLLEVRTIRSALTLGEFYTRPEEIDLAAPYQRPSVWELEQRRKLIESIMRGVPIAAIVLSDLGNKSDVHWRVVDGKQRLETVIGFTQDEFSVPGHWFRPESLVDGEEARGGDVRWSDLSKVWKMDFRGRTLVVEQLRHEHDATEAEMIEAEEDLYLLINGGGTAHTEADLDRAR